MSNINYKNHCSIDEVGNNGSESKKIVSGFFFAHFFRSKVAKGSFILDKMLKKDSHDFGLFLIEDLWGKKFLNGGNSNVVSMVDLVSWVPVNEIFNRYLHRIFLNNSTDYSLLIIEPYFKSSEEDPQQIWVHVSVVANRRSCLIWELLFRMLLWSFCLTSVAFGVGVWCVDWYFLFSKFFLQSWLGKEFFLSLFFFYHLFLLLLCFWLGVSHWRPHVVHLHKWKGEAWKH